jgi:hypothetical protein
MDAQEAVARIIALRKLTEATGTITTRVQNRILQSLSDDVLAEVAVALKNNWALGDALSGRKPVGGADVAR